MSSNSPTLNGNGHAAPAVLRHGRPSDSDIAISVRDLAKCYTIQHEERQDVLLVAAANKLKNPLKRTTQETFWALDGVSFDVKRGEVVGIIGRNGAGKSTLLKVLSRITEPTRGEAVLHGRVGSLLEVGTGFHPELTGRENVYLNGAVLGMTRAEIDRQFDAIVDFSGTEKFLDTPVKRYSSGMYVRLAFAVAAHLNPEILIVDEVLAVGDAEFQKKCLGKMQDVADSGRTVLFVSHNVNAVKTLCGRVVWLQQGKLAQQGETSSVIAAYMHAGSEDQTEKFWHTRSMAPGNEEVRLRSAKVILENASNNETMLRVNTPFKLQFSYWNQVPNACLNISVFLQNEDGVCVFNSFSPPEKMPAGIIESTINIPGNLLNNSTYFVKLLVVRDAAHVALSYEDVLRFEIEDIEREVAWHGKWPGAVRPVLRWENRVIADEPL